MDVYDLIEAHKNQRKLQQGLLDPASVPYSALGSLHVTAQVLKLNRTMQPLLICFTSHPTSEYSADSSPLLLLLVSFFYISRATDLKLEVPNNQDYESDRLIQFCKESIRTFKFYRPLLKDPSPFHIFAVI